MFENQTYLGHLVSGKRRKASFKSKRIVKQDEDQWIVVKDMFPPLISEELWKDAHDRLNSRKRESKSGFVNIFAGLLKCDKCGYALGIANARNRENYFSCNTYKKKGPQYCSSHYIMYDELYAAVLADIRQVIGCVHNNKEDFMRMVKNKLGGSDVSETRCVEQEIASLEARIAELERKFDRLYDDRLEGILSDKKFKELSAKCEAEQDAVSERLAALKEKLSDQHDTELDAQRFVEAAMQYGDVSVLDMELLNHLVDSIVVGDRIRRGAETEQKIRINYKFIGVIE